MISTTLFLTAGLMASPVIIQDVKASREAGHLRVEVAGDGGIDPDGAHTRIDGGLLLIYLGGTRVRADNRSWDLADGAGEIKAHRHKFETELVVPLAGNGCTGPVELQGSDTGITALVGCDGSVAPQALGSKAVAKAKKNDEKGDETLKALVELPSEPAATVAAKAASPAPVDKGESKIKVEAAKPEAKAEAKVETKVAEAKAETKPGEGKADLVIPVATTASAAAGTATGGSIRSIGMPAVLLGLLAVGAYLFARRRRTISVRHIQILETASLGPKRSLVVAKVGEETLILGTSEAGITLLKNGAGQGGASVATTAPSLGALETVIANSSAAAARTKAEAAAAAEADAAAFEISQPLEEALADIPEPGDTIGNNEIRATARGGFRAIEGGLGALGGLFNGRRIEAVKDDSSEDGEAFPFETRSPARRDVRPEPRRGLKDRLHASEQDREDSFENLLEDSLEDQELRQKLAAGMSARVR